MTIRTAIIRWTDPKTGEKGRLSTAINGELDQVRDYYMQDSGHLNIGHAGEDRLVNVESVELAQEAPAMPSSITIIGKRWFQKSFGNTYHSAVVINDDTGEQIRAPFEYGYGDQWEETAARLIESAGWLPERERYSYGGRMSLHRWCQENGVTLHRNLDDVKRQKDL